MTGDQAAEHPSATCDHHWVHHHPAHSLVWIVRCALCDAFDVTDLNEQIARIVASAKATAMEEADTVFEGREFDGFRYVPRTMRQVRRVIRERAAHYRGQATL